MKRLLITLLFFFPIANAHDLNIDEVSDAIVNVSAKVKQPLTDALDSTKKANQIAFGSGVIIDAKEGYIVTNAHVIQDPELIIVTLHDGTRLKAKEIGKDKMTDLALIQVQSTNLVSMSLSKNKPEVGDRVIAVGNPFGLDHTITSGIISGLNRQLGQLYNLIQTDAPINPGNSGGALVDSKGELLGICTAITTVTGGSIGLGFVIPIDTVQPIIDQLKKYGDVKRGTFGVVVQEISPALHKILKLQKDHKGVMVAEVIDDSPAQKSGIKVEDVIYKINGHDTNNPNELKAAISSVRIDSDLTIQFLRNNKNMTIKSTTTNFTGPQKPGSQLSGAQMIEYKELNKDNELQTGLLVTDVKEGSEAFLIGLQKGDLIKAIDRKPIGQLANLKSILQTKDQPLLITVERDEQNLYIGSI